MKPGEHIIWIVDSSPLIVLAKSGQLDLLTAPGRRVLLTESVAREIEAGASSDPARQVVTAGWGERTPDPAVPAELADWVLDAGEEATLALALANRGALAVLDDGDGRRAAQSLGIPFTGTIGVALQARQSGRVPALFTLILAFHHAGLFLPSDTALKAVLATVGETWP